MTKNIPDKDKKNGKDDKLNMRQIAEKKLQDKERILPKNLENLSRKDVHHMIHELQVHQIELEMQNEELQRVQTELDISERKYFDLYDLAPVGYLTLNEEGVILEANLTASKLLGMNPRELVNAPFTRFIMRDDQDLFYKHQRSVRKTLKHTECELRMTSYGDAEFWALLSTLPVEDAQGNFNYRVILSDITRRKETERELMKAKKKAVAANEAKTQFLANMSHEIRTPLNGLMGMTHLLTMTELNEEQRDLTKNLETSSEALLSVIGDILDYSKIEAGEMQLENVLFQPKKVLEDVVRVFGITAAGKDLSIEIKGEEPIPVLIGDSFRFRQVLTNLISNAIKYTPHGKIEVELKAIKLPDNHKIKLECSVQDTGIGIHPEKIQSMFERFSQADSSNTRQYGGTGLGLAICKGIVDKMGGEIWAESIPEKGSRFTFTCIMELTDE